MNYTEVEQNYENFIKDLVKDKKGIEKEAYLDGHKDVNQYFLDFIDQLPEEEKPAFDRLKVGAEIVIKCIDKIKTETEE